MGYHKTFLFCFSLVKIASIISGFFLSVDSQLSVLITNHAIGWTQIYPLICYQLIYVILQLLSHMATPKQVITLN